MVYECLHRRPGYMAEVEFVLLANHAEAHNGLLYLSGAGWNDAALGFTPEGPSTPLHFGVGVSVLVPWTETNRKHHLQVRMEHEDGGEPLFGAAGDLEVGRPAGVQQGADQRAVLAIDGITQFPKAGGYRLVAQVNGGKMRTVSFRVRNLGVLPLPAAS
jgi:hypothetical protein